MLSDRPPLPPAHSRQEGVESREDWASSPPGRVTRTRGAGPTRRFATDVSNRSVDATGRAARVVRSRVLGPRRSSTRSDFVASQIRLIPTGERRDGARHGRHRRGDARGERTRGVHQVPGRTFAFPSSPPIPPQPNTRPARSREFRHHPPTFSPAPTNIKSSSRVVPSLSPPLPTSQLDNPVQVDRKLHRSGRHPEDIYWSSNPKYVNKAKIVGRQSSAVDSTIYRKLREEKEAIARRQEERAERLRKMRDANATDDLENLEAKLMDVHRAYGEYRRFPEKRRFRRAPVFGAVPDDENGVHEITTVGWQRLVRDAGILDNAVTATDMDALFTAVDAGRVGARMENKNWRDRREATGARFSDLRLDFDEFRVALRRAATVRYPEAKDESRAYAALLRNHVLARCARTRIAHDRDLDELLSRESMNEVTSRDVALRRVYGHYATLHMFSATTQKINW